MQSELKPCPFCGSDRLMVLPPTCDRDAPYSAADRAYSVVRCSGCYTDVPGKDFDASSKSAVEAWNRRAALSDKQAGEAKAHDVAIRKELGSAARALSQLAKHGPYDDLRHGMEEISHRMFRVLQGLAPSALVDVPAIEPVSNDLIGYVLRYGGMCRDCADMDGVCQSGQPCDTEQRRAVVKHTVAALAYGIKHGFIANPFASPPLSREGEDSAEVTAAIRSAGIKARDELLERMADGGSVDNDLADYMSRIIDACERAALAATRSGSATTQIGSDHG